MTQDVLDMLEVQQPMLNRLKLSAFAIKMNSAPLSKGQLLKWVNEVYTFTSDFMELNQNTIDKLNKELGHDEQEPDESGIRNVLAGSGSQLNGSGAAANNNAGAGCGGGTEGKDQSARAANSAKREE